MVHAFKRSCRALLTVTLAAAFVACGGATPGGTNKAPVDKTPVIAPAPLPVPDENAPTSSGTNVQVQNLDGGPFADRLVFNILQALTYDPGKVLVDHPEATLRVFNKSAQPVQLTGFNFVGPWQRADSGVLTIDPGKSVDVTIKFTATGGEAEGTNVKCFTYEFDNQTYHKCQYSGSLTITTTDPVNATIKVELAGSWQPRAEGSNEPTLQQLVEMLGYKTNIGWNPNDPQRPLGTGEPTVKYGDEVLSAFWRSADSSKPVVVRTLAMFHGRNDPKDGSTLQDQHFYWYAKGTELGKETQIMIQDPNGSQRLFPHKRTIDQAYTDAGLAVVTFNPGATVFGLRVQDEYTEPARNSQAVRPGATLCPTNPAGANTVRFWPAKDRAGTVIPNTYLVGMDAYCDNHDFNDNVYLISNIKPE